MKNKSNIQLIKPLKRKQYNNSIFNRSNDK